MKDVGPEKPDKTGSGVGGGFEVFGRPKLKIYIRFSSLLLRKIIYACERGVFLVFSEFRKMSKSFRDLSRISARGPTRAMRGEGHS